MTFGLGLLRLSPAALWAMTPKEFSVAMRAYIPETERIQPAQLRDLMERFPDR